METLCVKLTAGAVKNGYIPVGSGNTFLVEDMESAFSIIKQQLDEGDVCLLSPAAASYGMFRNFEERGEVFKKMAADQ